MIRLLALASLALAPFLAPPTTALAQEQQVTTRYVVSLLGLPMGRAEFKTTLGPDRYSVEGTLNSAGLASLFSQVRGTSSASGGRGANGLSPQRYGLAYTAEEKSWRADVTMRGGQVTASEVAPRRDRNRPADYIPVDPADLTDVVDPLSGIMVDAPAGEVCNRTLPLYDGWTRLDLVLSPAGTRPFQAEGFDGQAVVCNARVRPVSGYRRGSSGLRYLRDQTVQFWFAAIGDTDIHAPVYARVPTKVGPLSLTATTFAAR